ncbi:hypothetical protein KY361_00200 [Candidatus Woesearchaeota archaeon]|nr:hypothetical protein [Candidatus Woesearchaeota archaeon]
MNLEERVRKQEERKSLFALLILVVVLLTFIWNFLILPSIVEKTITRRNEADSCNNFCANVNGATRFELEYHYDQGLAYCYCRDIEGKILARPTYNLGN